MWSINSDPCGPGLPLSNKGSAFAESVTFGLLPSAGSRPSSTGNPGRTSQGIPFGGQTSLGDAWSVETHRVVSSSTSCVEGAEKWPQDAPWWECRVSVSVPTSRGLHRYVLWSHTLLCEAREWGKPWPWLPWISTLSRLWLNGINAYTKIFK